MDGMEWIVIVTALALAQFIWFGVRVGQMRGKHGVRAPETVGDPEFMRMHRIHQNTMEQLVVFVPSLWLFAHYIDPRWAAGIGLVYVVSRFMYYSAYLHDPSTRSRGFGLGIATELVLLLGALVGAVLQLF